MEKLLKLLPWLNVSQALKLLENKTDTPVSSHDLLQLCDFGHCSVYLDCLDWKGEIAIDVGEETPMYQPVTGRGFCKVEYPLQLADDTRHGIHVVGPALVINTGKVIKDCEWWIAECETTLRPVFDLADIEALAAKMNREDEQPSDRAAELEDLRQQLGHERPARETAEAEVTKLREAMRIDAQIAETTLEFQEFAREDLKRAYAAIEAAQAEAEALRQEIKQKHAEAKPSHLLAIAGMLELLLDDRRPRYQQDKVAEAIEAKGWRGASASGLSKLFAKANATAKEADKVAKAKAEAMQSVLASKTHGD